MLRILKLALKGNTKLWHLYIGYLGPLSLYYLKINIVGIKLKTTQKP